MPLRREVLIGFSATVATVACGPSIVFTREPQITPENFNRGPQLGDLIIDRGGEYLLRSGVAMRTPPRYWEFSKGNDFGRKRFTNLSDFIKKDIFERFPKQENIDVPKLVIDEFSGQERRGMPDGGEMIVYFGGAWTSRGFPLDGSIKFDNDPFVKIRGKLEEKNFRLYNSNFYTYEAYGLKEYKASDTLRPVPYNIRAAIAFMDYLKRSFPFVQFHVVAHSLGGIFALEAVKRHMDIVNSLTLIDVPFGGLDTPAKEVQEALGKIGTSIKDNPATYLDEIVRNPNTQKDLDKFGSDFRGRGRKFNIVRGNSDKITEKSQSIKGAKLLVIEGGHGRGLDVPEVHELIGETTGQNLAMAA